MELQIKEVKVHYDMVEALKGISLKINLGETISIMGANGAGKTTMVKAISGLKKITSGEIWFKDKRIDKFSSQDIVRLGVVQVPEGKRLFKNMTVLENLLMGAYLKEEREEVIKSLKEIYGHFPVLEMRRSQVAGSLSGGEQQMLSISRALMATPEILLLDEPSIGLSPLMVGEITKVISNISKGGISVLLIEQNTRLAFKLSQRGYVMETGRIVLEGSTVDLQKNDYVKKAYLGG
jgi:branched-chain amino acid transport system ATP-binding protein